MFGVHSSWSSCSIALASSSIGAYSNHRHSHRGTSVSTGTHAEGVCALSLSTSSSLLLQVAVEQLRTHSKYIGTAEFPLLPLARPPSHYAFNRGHLPALHPSPPATADHGETTPMDPSFVFCFHRPPYNSIDHLHLHAIQKPYRTWRSRFMFGENFRWHASIDSVFRNLPLAKAKL